jgi:putative membrane protein
MCKPIQLILALALAATAAACEHPASDGTAGTAGTSPAADARPTGTSGDQSDNQFVKDLTSGNTTEVALGRVAQQKSASADVKAFGEMMVRDHTEALDALKQAAARQNIEVPAVVNEKHRDLRQRLAALTAKDFDREYMNAMVDAHEATVKKLKDRVDDGNDALSQFASTILPTVQHHLEQAKQIRDKLTS